MIWKKKGLIYKPDTSKWWSKYYGILPTPDYIEEKGIIRIYFATTDEDFNGRLGCIDVNEENPSKIVNSSNNYIFDIGKPGTFDDGGVNPSSIINIRNEKLMYYIGYQRHQKTPYSILTGLAKFEGDSIIRTSNVPLLERTNNEFFIRSAPSVIFENGIYKMWYVSAHSWETMNHGIFKGKQMPNYVIKYAESNNGIDWKVQENPCIYPLSEDEFGFGRPWVVKKDGLYKIWYSIRKKTISYRIGYAESKDGINWKRKDNEVGIDVSKEGWDSEMICYAAVIEVKNKTFMFYNGNENGKTGFGYAELV